MMQIINLTSNVYELPGLRLHALETVTVSNAHYLQDEGFRHLLHILDINGKVEVIGGPVGYPVATALELELQAEGESGNGGAGSVLPVATPTGATVDTTTYDNSLAGVGKFTTLVFPSGSTGESGALAIAFEGDAFPRIIMAADPSYGTFIGDGTVEPLSNGAASWIEPGAAGEFVHVIEGGGATQMRIGVPDTNTGRQTTFSAGVSLAHGTGATVSTSLGAPVRGGNLNDICVRVDAPDVNHWLYRCTVAGSAGNATWVPVGGLT